MSTVTKLNIYVEQYILTNSLWTMYAACVRDRNRAGSLLQLRKPLKIMHIKLMLYRFRP